MEASSLQQVREVKVLLVGHVLQTVLAVDLCTSFVELVSHRVILEDSGKSSCLALVTLLLLAPSDVQDLEHDDHPEDDPDDQDTLESIDLNISLATCALCNFRLWSTYVLRCELGVEDVGCDNVANGVASVERGVVDGFLCLSSTVAAHPGDEERVDGVYESNEVVSGEQTALVGLGLWQCDHQSNSHNDNRHKTEQEWRLALEAVCKIRSTKNRNELECSRWHVEKHCLIRGETSKVLKND